jgi:CubicO group peptidase (beta-lactamase class C family)
MMELFVEMTPITTPGKVHAYHGLTYGWPLGEIVRRIDGRAFARFVQEEICAPLGIKNLFFGVPAERAAQKTRLSHDLDTTIPATSVTADPVAMANHPSIQTASIPAANMMANARSIARFYASLIGEGVNGVRLLPPRRVTNATVVQRWGMDQTLERDMGFGLGYILGHSVPTQSSRINAFGHDGWGGAAGFADPDYGLAVGFTKTRMTLNPQNPSTSLELMQTLRAGLQIPE